MSLARSCTTFVIDLSPTMGETRQVVEQLEMQALTRKAPTPQQPLDPLALDANYARDEAEPGNAVERARTVTNLGWAMEFVTHKVQAAILSGLKTAKVCVITYGSTNTSNAVLETTEISDGYEGVEEIYMPASPTIDLLETLRRLRPTRRDQARYPADPLDAIIAAILTNNNKDRGGINVDNGTSHLTWNRTIYLITDGRTDFDKSDAEHISEKLKEGNFKLKVLGVDFDDPDLGISEEKKDPVKAANERWWQDFLEPMRDLGAGMATAADAIDQTRQPTLQLKRSAPLTSSLLFGNPDKRFSGGEANHILNVPIRIAKATAVERPMSQKKMSKLGRDAALARQRAQARDENGEDMSKREAESNAGEGQARAGSDVASSEANVDRSLGEGGGGGVASRADRLEAQRTYGVDLVRQYYVRDELERTEGGIRNVAPLPEGAEQDFARAYKLGASLVSMDKVDVVPYESLPGMEIMHFISAAKYRRHYHLGETSYVYADEGNPRAQLQLSSLVQAMAALDKLALVRYVRSKDAEPRLGVLAPVLKEEDAAQGGRDFECFYYVDVPFREDLRREAFPPLHRVVNREGKELQEHRNLPTAEMQTAMDELVESMDLMDAYEDDDGFNPAIHRVKDAVCWRVSHPDDREVPRPHPEVDKFLSRPPLVEERSKDKAQRVKEVFKLEYAPSEVVHRAEVARSNKRAKNLTEPRADEDRTLVLDDGGAFASEEDKAKRARKDGEAGSNSDSDTEEEEDEATWPTRQGTSEPLKTERGAKVETRQGGMAASTSRADDEGQEGGADDGGVVTIDPANPIYDFRRALEKRFAERAAFSAMFAVVRRLVYGSMGSDTYGKAAECMRVCRREAIEYDEVELWNDFVASFKEELVVKHAGTKHTSFWEAHMRHRRDVGLISAAEDWTGTSELSEGEVKKFVTL